MSSENRIREKIPTSYQDVALRIAVNADFRFVTQHCLKNRRRKSLIFGDDFRPKNAFSEFTAKRTVTTK